MISTGDVNKKLMENINNQYKTMSYTIISENLSSNFNQIFKGIVVVGFFAITTILAKSPLFSAN